MEPTDVPLFPQEISTTINIALTVEVSNDNNDQTLAVVVEP